MIHRLCGLALLGSLLFAAPLLAHEGHQSSGPPKPKTAMERLHGVFFGAVPDTLPTAQPIRIRREVPGVTILISYIPAHVLPGLGEPVRFEFRDATTQEPLSGYAPKVEYTFPSGLVARGTMVELNGLPGIYQYWPAWKEPGAIPFTVRIGQGPQALLPEFTETIYVKRPHVPVSSYVFAGLLAALALGGAAIPLMKGAPRSIALVLALAIGIGGAFLIRAPLAARVASIERAEQAMLAQADIERPAPWPDALPTIETSAFASPATSPGSTISATTTPASGTTSSLMLGTLRFPDDASALLSAPQTGVFETARILSRGTAVTKGQSFGTVRVFNDAIAPEAVSAPGDVAEARQALTNAELEVTRAERELERGRRLLASEAISQREFESREQALALAESARTAAQERLQASERRATVLQQLGGASAYRTFPIVSPLDGIVTEVSVTAGATVTEGQLLYTITDPSRLWLEAHLFEDQLEGLTPGTRVTFTTSTNPGTAYHAVLRSLGLALDPESRTLPVLFDVVPPLTGLYAGQTVTLTRGADDQHA